MILLLCAKNGAQSESYKEKGPKISLLGGSRNVAIFNCIMETIPNAYSWSNRNKDIPT